MKQSPSGKFIPYLFVIFFSLLFLADFYLIYCSKKSYSGLASGVELCKDFYRKFASGTLISNDHLPFKPHLTLKKQSSNIWLATLRFLETQEDMHIDKVIMKIMSPVTDKHDQTISFTNVAKNLYEANFECMNGQWDMEILVALPESHYIISQRTLLHNTLKETDVKFK